MNAQYGSSGEKDWTGRKRNDRDKDGRPTRGLPAWIVVVAVVIVIGVVVLTQVL